VKERKCEKREPIGYGDVNGDGFVTDEDRYMIFDWVSEFDGEDWQKEAADINNNGDVDIGDYVAIYNYIYGFIDTFPVCEDGNWYDKNFEIKYNTTDLVSGLAECKLYTKSASDTIWQYRGSIACSADGGPITITVGEDTSNYCHDQGEDSCKVNITARDNANLVSSVVYNFNVKWCNVNGESCSVDSDCCSGHCSNGICCDYGSCCISNDQCEPYEYCNLTYQCYDLRNDISACDYYDYCSSILGNLAECETATKSGDYSYCKVYGKTNEEMWEICRDDTYAAHSLLTC
jgi:hypothetical protein